MVSSRPWGPSIYNTKFTVDEHLLSLPAILAGTCEDMYDDQGNIVFNAVVDTAGDIIVTTVDDNGNTIISMVDDDTDSILTIDLGDSLSIHPVDATSSDDSAQPRQRCDYPKLYHPPPPKLRPPHTNKHK